MKFFRITIKDFPVEAASSLDALLLALYKINNEELEIFVEEINDDNDWLQLCKKHINWQNGIKCLK